MAKLSFVVPLYNKEAYIADCLESILRQTVRDIEVVVVNDGSTDDSMDVVTYFANRDKRVRIHGFPANYGRSQARNHGNLHAKSKIIAVQDADDIAGPTRAEEILKAFKKKIDVFYSSFYSSEYVIEARPFNIEDVKKDKFTYIGHSTMAYTKKVALAIPYQTGDWSDLGIDDWRFQMDCYGKGCKFGFSAKPLILYRQTSNSVSVTRNQVEVLRAKEGYLKNAGFIR